MTPDEAREIIKQHRGFLELSRRLSAWMSIGPVFKWSNKESVDPLYQKAIDEAAVEFSNELNITHKRYGPDTVDPSKVQHILSLYESGMTLQQIGDSLEPKITRERVRQLLKRTDYTKKHRISPEGLARKEHLRKRGLLVDCFKLHWNRDEVLEITGYDSSWTDEQLCEAVYREFHITRMHRYIICVMCKSPKVLAEFMPSCAQGGMHRVCRECNKKRRKEYLHRKAAEIGESVYQYRKRKRSPQADTKHKEYQRNYQRMKYRQLREAGVVAKCGSPEHIAKIAATKQKRKQERESV